MTPQIDRCPLWSLTTRFARLDASSANRLIRKRSSILSPERMPPMTDWMNRSLADADPEIAAVIASEEIRLAYNLEMIASENFVSEAVLEAQGSVLTNKYTEGYPAKRYYGGCEFVDVAENIARERAKQLFGCEHVNVQPHSGSQANQAVYLTVLNYRDKVLGMSLAH